MFLGLALLMWGHMTCAARKLGKFFVPLKVQDKSNHRINIMKIRQCSWRNADTDIIHLELVCAWLR